MASNDRWVMNRAIQLVMQQLIFLFTSKNYILICIFIGGAVISRLTAFGLFS